MMKFVYFFKSNGSSVFACTDDYDNSEIIDNRHISDIRLCVGRAGGEYPVMVYNDRYEPLFTLKSGNDRRKDVA